MLALGRPLAHSSRFSAAHLRARFVDRRRYAWTVPVRAPEVGRRRVRRVERGAVCAAHPVADVAAVITASSASMSSETIGIVAAAATPLLGAVGLFIWNKVWTGDAYTLNLVKCTLGSFGFVVVGLATRGAGWLAAATPETVAWLVVSAFVGIVIGDNLWLHSLQVLGARRVILIDILKPFIALAMARLVLLEGISVSVALGMVVTLCGVLAVSLEKTEDHERGPAENNTGKDGDVDGSIPDDVLLEVALDAARAPKDDDEAAGADAKPVVFSSGGDRMVTGYVAAALNVAFDTWGTVLTKQHGGALNTWEINLVRFGSAALALALGAAFRGRTASRGIERATSASTTGNATDARRFLPELTPREWGQVAAGVAFTTFLAPGLGNFALFRVSSLAVFSTLLCVGPIYSLPLGYLIKGERVTCRAVVGSVVAVLGVVPMFFGEQLGFP